MIEGLVFGAVSYLSLLLSWFHLPNVVKRFSQKHPLLTDIAASTIAYVLISSVSKSLVAVIAAISCGLFVNFTILGVKTIND
jgi:hypothetical protein